MASRGERIRRLSSRSRHEEEDPSCPSQGGQGGVGRGCGDVRVPTLITVFFVCGLRMLWLFIAVPIRHEVATVEMSYPITWSLASALFILYYVKGGWMQRCAEKWEKKQAG